MGVLSIQSMTGSGTLGAVATGWSVTESATSVSIAEQTGGTGSASFTAVKTPTSKFVIDNLITLDTGGLGTLEGIVGDTSITGDSVGVTVAPTLSLLLADRSAPPTGEQALSTIFASYVALVTDQITVDYQASADPLRIYPGWSGSVWNFLQQLCAFNRVEMAANGSVLMVRDVGSVEYDLTSISSPTFAASVASTGRSIDVVVQNTALVASLPGSKYNYSQNPSLEANATGWTVTNTSGFGSHSYTRDTAWASSGATSARCRVISAGSTSDPIAIQMRHEIDVTELFVGELYSASFVFHTDAGNIITGGQVSGGYGEPITAKFEWLNASSVVIGTSVVQTTLQVPSLTKTFSAPSMEKPAGATKFRMTISIPQFFVRVYGINYPYGVTGPAYYYELVPWLQDGDLLYMDAAILTNGALIPFFDGNSAGAAWLGASNNSQSAFVSPEENDFYNALEDNNAIYSVAVGETVTTTVQTLNYPTYLAQPIPSSSLPSEVGTYHVSGADNLPVVPAEWAAYGGSVAVAISQVPGAIDITLTGPTVEIPGVPGPYSLSASDGNAQYATLRVAGVGVTTAPETLNLLTGASPDKTTVEVAATVNSPFCINRQVAYDHASWAVAAAAGPNSTLSFSVPTDSLPGLGLTEGAMFLHQDARYRVTGATIGHSTATITAARHTTIGEMDAIWGAQRLGNFDELWDGFSAGDVNIAPLRTE